MQTHRTKPLPTSYLDLHSYLKDIYAFRKSQDPKFSYQTWAKELNLKSRSSLRLVITGEKILTRSLSEALTQDLQLMGLEKEYFLLMSSHQLESDPTQKKLLMRRMLDLLKFISGQKEYADSNDFLNHPQIPALQVLLSFEDIPRDPKSLAAILNQEASLVNEWLRTLESLELAKLDTETQQWHPLSSDFKISDKPGSRSLQNYHAAILAESALAIDLPAHTRRFRSLMMALDESQYESFSSELNVLLTQLLAKYSSTSMNGKKLYRYATALVPITQRGFVSSKEHDSTEATLHEAPV